VHTSGLFNTTFTFSVPKVQNS